jgi:hypothetical protein
MFLRVCFVYSSIVNHFVAQFLIKHVVFQLHVLAMPKKKVIFKILQQKVRRTVLLLRFLLIFYGVAVSAESFSYSFASDCF